jgi:hypothetical protein
MIENGGFEKGLAGWASLWAREEGAGNATLSAEEALQGRQTLRIVHTGANDWSLHPNARFQAKEGELYALEAWLKVEGQGSATLSVVLMDEAKQVMDWSYAEKILAKASKWTLVKTTVLIPAGCAAFYPRIIGYGPATVQVDGVSLKPQGTLGDWLGDVPGDMQQQNELISVQLHTREALLTVTDRRSGTIWTQALFEPAGVVRAVTPTANGWQVDWLHLPSGQVLRLNAALEPERPEIRVELAGEGAMQGRLSMPYPFVSKPGMDLIIPMNEGISYPANDASIPEMSLITYGGHGICMPFWGVTDGQAGYMAIFETPNDAQIRIERLDGLLCVAPAWVPEKQKWGYPRQLRYVFFDQGGYVAIAKRYRAYAQEKGLFKTLKEKRDENPNVDRLVGAVNIWNWDSNAVQMVKALQETGIERILWSNRASAEDVMALNAIEGVLTSRYDIFQDCMNPDNFSQLRGVHSDWTTEGWPKDIVLDASGDWERGWAVRGKDGEWYPCGVLCDKQTLPYARERVGEELTRIPYRSRFIDTTTASPWRECYHPDHPMTRTESRYYKMELLRLISEEFHLVTGSETGHDAAVPYTHYFEGMLSLGPYRVPDAGRNMIQVVDEVPEQVAKFQLGHAYRLPLWELVYHDCLVAQWYWGDYNNKLPALWVKRDLFNLLYGTPPMFMFTKESWEKSKTRFVESYQTVCPTVRKVGYAEMLEHRYLSSDRAVQQTRFGDGTVITVNFGDRPHTLEGGQTIAGMGYLVQSQ